MLRSGILLGLIYFISCSLSQSHGQNFTAETKYEQFGTEILIYLQVQNNSEKSVEFGIEHQLSSIDLSGYPLKSQYSQSVVVQPSKKTSINLRTVEYSVLSETTSYTDVINESGTTVRDTLHLNFPNKFRNVENKDVEIDLGGLKVDRTRTPVGRQFFENFENNWKAPPGSSDYTIIIEELPFRFRTTILKVYLDNEKVLETYLRDDKEFLDQILNYVIGSIRQTLANRKSRNDELGGNYNGI